MDFSHTWMDNLYITKK